MDTTTTTSTTSTSTSVGDGEDGGNVRTTAKMSASQMKAELMKSINFNSDASELAKLKRDQLLQLCYDNKMNVNKSGKKQYYIDEIVKLRNEQSRLKKILVDENTLNQFHRGYVAYKLPVLLIVRIFRQCWKLATARASQYYKDALALTLVSKQFNGLVTPWFTNVILRSTGEEFIDELNEHFPRPWCPIKQIVKLKVNQPMFTLLMNKKNVSVHLAHMLASVEKLHIVWDKFSTAVISPASIKRLPLLMPNLRYLVCVSIKLEREHFDAIMNIKTLTKIDLSRPYKGRGDYNLYNAKLPLEKILLREMSSHLIPRDENYRMAVKEIGYVSSRSNPKKPLELPNLQKISFAMYVHPPDTLSHFKQETFNITHLAAFLTKLKGSANEWAKVIEQLRCIVTVEDLNPHSSLKDRDCCRNRLCIGFKDCLSPTLSRIIVYSNHIDDKEQYLSSIGYKYSFHTHCGRESFRESHKAIYYETKREQPRMNKYFFEKEVVQPPSHTDK